MPIEITLESASLFQLNKENGNAQANHISTMDFENNQYLRAKNIFKNNILRRLGAKESRYSSTESVSEPPIDISSFGFSGRLAVSSVIRSINDVYFEQYTQVIDAEGLEEIQAMCAIIANRLSEDFHSPKGIACFVKYQLQLNRGDYQDFLAILITNYSEDIVQVNDQDDVILDYIDKAFTDEFSTTTLYPHVTGLGDGARGLTVDNQFIKIYNRSKQNKEIYSALGVTPPLSVEKSAVSEYEENRLDFETIEEMHDELDSLKYVFVNLVANEEVYMKIKLKDFIEGAKLIVTDYGQGIVFKDKVLDLKLGKYKLFSEQKIIKYPPEDFEEEQND